MSAAAASAATVVSAVTVVSAATATTEYASAIAENVTNFPARWNDVSIPHGLLQPHLQALVYRHQSTRRP